MKDVLDSIEKEFLESGKKLLKQYDVNTLNGHEKQCLAGWLGAHEEDGLPEEIEIHGGSVVVRRKA